MEIEQNRIVIDAAPVEDDEHHEVVYTIEYEQKQVWVDLIVGFFSWFMLSILTIGIFLPFIIFLPLIYVRFMYVYRRRKCYITSVNIVLKQEDPFCFCCLPTKTEKHVQLQNVVDVTVSQNFIQRWFDCWTIQIQNPGQTGPNGASSDLLIYGCKNPTQVKRLILDISQKLKSGGGDVTGATTANRNYGSIAKSSGTVGLTPEVSSAIIDIRDLLKRIDANMSQQPQGGSFPQQQPIVQYPTTQKMYQQ